MDPASIVGLVAAAIQLAQLACTVLSNCFGWYQDVKDSRKEAADLRGEVYRLLTVIEEIQVVLEDKDPSETFPFVRSEFVRTLALLIEAQEYTKPAPGVRGLKWAFHKRETMRLIERIKAQKLT